MVQLNNRLKDILAYINNKNGISNKEILAFINYKYDNLSRFTIIRDLDKLVEIGGIRREGKGRNVKYYAISSYVGECNPGEYFKLDADQRAVKYPNFNLRVFEDWKDQFNAGELKELASLNDSYSKRVAELPPDILKKERERLTIELSWKSSRIEGNTYSLLETEALIKENHASPGHSAAETQMILNHKATLDYIAENADKFKTLDIRLLEDVHRLLVDKLNVETGLRRYPVGITGTVYRPLDNQFQIREAVEKMIVLINGLDFPLEKSLAVALLIAYIQPFVDGNKRSSRLIGNALLLAYGHCPLSYRSIDEQEYKKAVILFYEQNSAGYFKELFVQQYKFSIENYFRL